MSAQEDLWWHIQEPENRQKLFSVLVDKYSHHVSECRDVANRVEIFSEIFYPLLTNRAATIDEGSDGQPNLDIIKLGNEILDVYQKFCISINEKSHTTSELNDILKIIRNENKKLKTTSDDIDAQIIIEESKQRRILYGDQSQSDTWSFQKESFLNYFQDMNTELISEAFGGWMVQLGESEEHGEFIRNHLNRSDFDWGMFILDCCLRNNGNGEEWDGDDDPSKRVISKYNIFRDLLTKHIAPAIESEMTGLEREFIYLSKMKSDLSERNDLICRNSNHTTTVTNIVRGLLNDVERAKGQIENILE